jgi:hypothetical protein
MTEQDSVVLDPPHEIFLLDEEGSPSVDPLRRREDLAPGLVVCIRNPWRPENFARGLVRGRPDAMVLELGNSLGALEFDEGAGWTCRGFVKKTSVYSGLAEDMVEQATEVAYTDELIRRLSGKSPTPWSKLTSSKKGPPEGSVPLWAVNAFWSNFASRVRPEAEVSVATSEVEPTELRNAMGEALDVPSDMGRCYLFFVDQHPEANWAHECAYALVGRNDIRRWVEARWPPEESVELNGVTPR